MTFDLTPLGSTNWIQPDGVNPTTVNAKKVSVAPGSISTPTALGTGGITAAPQTLTFTETETGANVGSFDNAKLGAVGLISASTQK